MAKNNKEINEKIVSKKIKEIVPKKVEEKTEGPKIKLSAITDFIIGFVLMWVILLIHANMALTQFWGLISATQVALSASLIVSIVLFVAYILFMLFCIFGLKRPFIAVGSIVAFPLVYLLSATVREGFAIFFYFI